MIRYVIRGQKFTRWCYVLCALAIFLLAVSTWHGGWKEALWMLPFAIIVCTLGYLLYWNPRIEADQQAIHVVNIVREYFIPWEDLESVETKFGLYLYAFHLPRKVPVWAVPSRMGISEIKAAGESSTSAATQGTTAQPGQKNSAHHPRTGDQPARTALVWDKAPGTYPLTMPLTSVAHTLRATHARLLGRTSTIEFEHNELNPASIKAREGARKHAESCGKTSSSGANVAGIVSLSLIALMMIVLIVSTQLL